MEYAENFMKRSVAIIDVTNKAVEETASRVLEIYLRGERHVSKKYVYLFEEGNAGMKNLLGGKGANLARNDQIGLPVPPGLIVTTEACKDFTAQGQQFPQGWKEQIRNGIALLKKKTGKRLATRSIHCWYQSVQVLLFPCPG